MPAETSQNTHDSDREELVAYLDGELSAAQAQAVEERLRSDARYQEELQSLERAWNALDNLPREKAGEDFTKTTIAMATTEARQEAASRTAAIPIERRRRQYSLIAVAATAALLGFIAIRFVTTAENRELARDLPVVLQVNVLTQVQNEPFLRRLLEEQPRLVSDFTSHDVQQKADAWTELTRQSLRGRSGWVRALNQDQKAELATLQRQFSALAPARQEALRSIDATLQQSADPSPEELRLAAIAYFEWLSTLTPVTRAELRQIPTDEQRLDRINELRREQLASAPLTLTREDSAALLAAVRKVADQEEAMRIPQIIAARITEAEADLASADLPKDQRRYVQEYLERGRRFEEALKSYAALRVSVVAQTAHPFGRTARWVKAMIGDDYRAARDQAGADWRVIEERLSAALSPAVQQSLANQSEENRSIRLRQWMLKAAGDAMQPANLDQFFASDRLTNLERNELLALPRDEMQEQLRRYYVERELGGMDPRAFSGFGDRGDRDGDRRDRDGRRRDRDDD